ncbi:hypothetical protein SLS57_010127 [Botryosphaeria dothidea]
MEEVSPTTPSFSKLIATASPTDSNLVYSQFTESSRLYFTSTPSPPGPPGPVKLVYMVQVELSQPINRSESTTFLAQPTVHFSYNSERQSTLTVATMIFGEPTPSTSGVNTESAAGIGVGAAIGGILLTSIVFLLCFRRSKRRQARHDSEFPLKRSSSYWDNKGRGFSQVTSIGTWDSPANKPFPNPAGQASIPAEMSRLRSMINAHVHSYYRTSEVDLDAIDQDAIVDLMGDPPPSTEAIAPAIADSETRTPALRYLIASAIFSRISFTGHPETTFLPPEVGSCSKSMNGVQDYDQATMLQSRYGTGTITEDDSRSHNISSALEMLDTILVRLRARRDENAQRLRDLEEILGHAANFAFLVFSHPSSWVFDWQASPAQEPGSVVIFPALLQVTDENGQWLSHPHVFEEKEVAPDLII